MKKNKMLSLAAAMVLTTTSAMAFDALDTTAATPGEIVTHATMITNSPDAGFMRKNYNPNFPIVADGAITSSGYNQAVPAAADLEKSNSQFGDALIYSAFRTGDGWESEITVTNTSDTSAVVAKVVLYASNDSRELIDFNIYLSANDVFKFTIDENGVKTSDDSIEVSATIAQDVSPDSDADTVTMNTAGTERQIASTLPEEQGYAIIYAMAESDTEVAGNANHAGYVVADVNNIAYHKQHDELFLDYRELLDNCRAGAAGVGADSAAWRNALVSNANMLNGMILDDIEAPNVNADSEACADQANANYFKDVRFIDPSDGILFGSTSITNTGSGTDVNSRDILLPATALRNFTDGAMLLWTAGELATITDRNILAAGIYDSAAVAADAKNLEITSTYYSYSDDEMANILHVTSPVKRPLVQLLGNASYWSGVAATKPYGEYDFARTIYNDQEDKFSVASTVNTGVIVSPYNPDAIPTEDAILIESGGLANLQGPAVIANADLYKKGYVEVTFTKGGAAQNYPAIVTQMSAKTINGKPHTNWVYAPNKTVAP